MLQVAPLPTADILFGGPKGSMFHSLFSLNRYLFLFIHDIPVGNYADGSILYCTGLKISNAPIKLLSQWFKDNRTK